MNVDNVGITGAKGVLGKILVKKLGNKKIRHDTFNGDIRKKEDIKQWLEDNQFSSIIHLAAIVPTIDVKNNPDKAYQVNTIGTKNLIEGIKSLGKNPWLFYASTSHVYKSKDSPISEDDEEEPISDYGRTKHEAEKIAREYESLCIGRIFSFYHETQQKPFLYPTIKERLEKEDLDKPFELYGAQSIRDFLNAEEVADLIIKLMEKEAIGIYNIASGKGIKIKDFVQDLTDKKMEIKEVGISDYLVANITKLNKVLNR